VSYDLIAIGASWGGLHAVGTLLDGLHADVDPAVVVVQHRGAQAQRGLLEMLLQEHVERRVTEPGDKQPIERSHVYVAAADYHLLVENGHFALSLEERVNYARPSIDVFFQSVAQAYGQRAIGVVLTGANADGAEGLAAIKAHGGVAIVQDPATAARGAMPAAAIAATVADAVLPIEEIAGFLYGLCAPVART
jgi:two-component system, chemotaxis family, protein-glutamate methylesterase/glutaminase